MVIKITLRNVANKNYICQDNGMLGHARLDASGVLQHVMARAIERRKIFRDNTVREDFVGRLAGLTETEAWLVYSWALLPNHFHLPERTGRQPAVPVCGIKPRYRRL